VRRFRVYGKEVGTKNGGVQIQRRPATVQRSSSRQSEQVRTRHVHEPQVLSQLNLYVVLHVNDSA